MEVGDIWPLTLRAVFVFFQPRLYLHNATSFSARAYIFRISRSRFSFRVIGQRSRSQQQKIDHAQVCTPIGHSLILILVYQIHTDRTMECVKWVEIIKMERKRIYRKQLCTVTQNVTFHAWSTLFVWYLYCCWLCLWMCALYTRLQCFGMTDAVPLGECWSNSKCNSSFIGKSVVVLLVHLVIAVATWLSVCLCVCLLHWCIVFKRLSWSLCNLHQIVALPF